MPKIRDSTIQSQYIERMVKNLPLRAAVNLTQGQLGGKISCKQADYRCDRK